MMALEKHAVTAAHWPRTHYEEILAPGVEPPPQGLKPRSSTTRPTSVAPASSPRRLALVLEEETAVQGFLVARVVDCEWELENIAIAGRARRRGLGTRLLGEFLNLARGQGAQSVFLEVREGNRSARALYEKWAFEESGRRSRYYHDPEEDAVVYRLSFV